MNTYLWSLVICRIAYRNTFLYIYFCVSVFFSFKCYYCFMFNTFMNSFDTVLFPNTTWRSLCNLY